MITDKCIYHLAILFFYYVCVYVDLPAYHFTCLLTKLPLLSSASLSLSLCVCVCMCVFNITGNKRI
jgi:hypothetical protein